jgi:uncharacterized protein YjaZ
MRITDLTEDYLRYVIRQNDPASYESALPQLFEHYYAFWSWLQPYSFRNVDEILRRRNLILERLPILSERFGRKGLNLADIDAILFVGHGTSNGHAFRIKEQWVVWLPIEAYHSVQAVDVFVSHEIAHALHYQQQPDFYFKNGREKNQVFRQLVTEGLATLTSKEVLNISSEQALWADYLPPESIQQWYNQCLQRENELLYAVSNKLESADDQNRLFSFHDSDDVLENRAGYYVGLVIVERHMQRMGFSLQDLFAMSKQEFLRVFRKFLKFEPAQHAHPPDAAPLRFAAQVMRRPLGAGREMEF